MRAAVLTSFGAPDASEFEDPTAANGATVVTVLAAAINHVDLAKASGIFYTGPPVLPSVVGTDGVGRCEDGRLVYFDSTVLPYGSMAEQTLVKDEALISASEDVDPTVLAALGNAGLAAHTALQWRAGLQAEESVLVLGATGVVGRIAIQLARWFGAGRVVGAGRSAKGLARVAELGADATVNLDDADDLATALGGADVIIDLIWGRPAMAALAQAKPGVRLIQLGQLAAVRSEIEAPALRSRAADIRGHAIFHAPLSVRAAAYEDLARAVTTGRLTVDIESVPLANVHEAWQRQARGTGGVKLVVAPSIS